MDKQFKPIFSNIVLSSVPSEATELYNIAEFLEITNKLIQVFQFHKNIGQTKIINYGSICLVLKKEYNSNKPPYLLHDYMQSLMNYGVSRNLISISRKVKEFFYEVNYEGTIKRLMLLYNFESYLKSKQ